MLEAAQPLVVVRARQGRGQCGGPAHAAAAAAAATTLDQDHLAQAVGPGCPRRRPHHAPRVTTAPQRHAGGGAETFRGRDGGGAPWRDRKEAGRRGTESRMPGRGRSDAAPLVRRVASAQERRLPYTKLLPILNGETLSLLRVPSLRAKSEVLPPRLLGLGRSNLRDHFFFLYLVNCVNFIKRILSFPPATSLFLLPRICGVPGTVLSFFHPAPQKRQNLKY